MKRDFELTQNSKTVGQHQLEHTQAKVNKQAKLINKLCRDVSKVSDLVSNISKEFALQNRTVPAYTVGVADEKPTPDTDRSSKTKESEKQPNLSLDDSLREANFFLKTIGDWLVSFAKLHKSTLKRYDQANAEL